MVMPKVSIILPCLNEEVTLPITLQQLPRHVTGFDEVEWLVIDDGRPTLEATLP